MQTQSVILFFILLACQTGWGKVSVSGKILGYDGKSIVYYHPTLEGIYAPWWIEMKPSPNGSFKIEYENEGYGNIRISYKQMNFRFFHDSDSKIYFEIKEIATGQSKRIAGENIFLYYDSVKRASTVSIRGDYEAVNKFYNQNLRSSYFTTQMVDGNYYSHLVYNTQSTDSAWSLLDSLTQLEINQINQLPRAFHAEDPILERKEEEIRNYLKNEVHAFYGAIFLNGMFLKRKEHVIKLMLDSTATPDIYNRDWELMIEKLRKQMDRMEPIPGSPDYIDFMESMAYALSAYQQYDFPQNPTLSLDEMVVDRLFNYDTTLFRDEKTRFAYELSGLQRYLNDQLFYSPTLLHAVYDLQAKHPTSKHLQFYQPKIDKLKNSLELSRQEFAKAKIIESNHKSFNSLVKHFEGKNILVDVWATWCHPCLEDFKYKSTIQPLIDSGKIEVLYISIDKPQWEDRWRQSIKINELQGSHFRADTRFIQDMWNTIGDYKGAIPRYVLINKQGQVFKRTAARPSEGTELVNQIESLIRN